MTLKIDGDKLLRALFNERRGGLTWEAYEEIKKDILTGRFTIPEAAPKNLEEFERRLLDDPLAYAYYGMGRAVERDSILSPEQKSRKRMDETYSMILMELAMKDVPRTELRSLKDFV